MKRRGAWLRVGMVLALVVGAMVGTSAAPAAASVTDGVALELVVSGRSRVVDVTAPVGDERLFIVEQAGRIRIVEDGVVTGTFLDISGPVNANGNEQGLLGLAFDPDYADNGHFYVNYTSDAGGGDTRIARYTVSADPDVADAGSGVTLLTVDQPYTNHNGGQVMFGPDGYLYASIGDGGSGGDPLGHGQNKDTLLGTIVRIDPATGDAAPGNPFGGATAGADEIWAYGLRNPWRFDFDERTGDMFIGDVGQGNWEEIDRIPAGTGGLNFGWKEREGAHCYVNNCETAGLTDPIVEYPHVGSGCSGSVTGGKVYRGNDLPQLRGHYFYVDYCEGGLRSFAWDGGVTEQTNWDLLGPPSFVTTFGTDGFGELYIANSSSVHKFVSTANPECDFDGDGDAEVPVGVPGENHSGAADAGMVYVFDGNPDGFDPAADKRFWQGNNGVNNTAEKGDRFGEALVCGDFDGDGFWDLAIGAPGERRNGRKFVGMVNVLYGGPDGLSGNGDQGWHQDSDGIASTGQKFDRFGAALAAGDFNGDTYTDLAIGAPGERIGGELGAGAFHVLFGSASGLTSSGDQFWHQDRNGIQDEAEMGEQFASALAAGDFDGDGVTDLAVGVPSEGIDGVVAPGLVHLFPGTSDGLGKQDSLWHRGRGAIEGELSAGAWFGHQLAAGQLDADGFDDLIVGALDVFDGTGSVNVLYGGAGGFSGNDARWEQGQGALPGEAENGDRFSASLAVGDFNGDGIEDAAIGAANESRSGASSSGDVTVLHGSVSGVTDGGADLLHLGQAALAGELADDDRFAQSLTALDIDGDGDADLIVGIGAPDMSGRVHLIPGTSNGLTGAGDLPWDQDTMDVLGVAQAGDFFGFGLP